MRMSAISTILLSLLLIEFVDVAIAADYLVTDLNGNSNRPAIPYGINDSGWVVGNRGDGPFVYRDGTIGSIPGLVNYDFQAGASAINNRGMVLGHDRLYVYVWPPFVYNANNGILHYLDINETGYRPEGGQDQAVQINDKGQILGQYNLDGVPLPVLPGANDTLGHGLNNLGQVAGSAFYFTPGGVVTSAVIVSGSAVTNLGTLGGLRSAASDINDQGTTVGYAQRADGAEHAFSYSSGSMNDLGVLSLAGEGQTYSYANSINNLEQIVGNSSRFIGSTSYQHAFLYKSGAMTDLNSLIDPALNITLTDAYGINNREQIIAVGTIGGVQHGFLLTPAPGTSQFFPILPTAIQPGAPGSLPSLIFTSANSGAWHDPPAASGFSFQMTGSSLFTQILDFPVGFQGDFTVSVEGVALGNFGPGQSVDFVSSLGHGVSSFSISGIEPTVDSDNPQAFPIKLAFDTPTADFMMIGLVPEPSTLALAGSALVALVAFATRSRIAERRRRDSQSA